MSDETLKPCPFCGGEATVERIGKSGYYYVACNTAYCCDFGKFDTEAEVIAAWNTRADTEYGGIPATEENMAKCGWVREEIVRCRDCVYRRNGWNGKRPTFSDWFFCAYWGGHELTNLDGFCAWAERKEGGEC